MTTTKSYLAGLGMTGIVIGSVLVLLAVGTGLVAFQDAQDGGGLGAPLERVVVGKGDQPAAKPTPSPRDAAPVAAARPPLATAPVSSQPAPSGVRSPGTSGRRERDGRTGRGHAGARVRTSGLGGGAPVREASQTGGGVAADGPPVRARGKDAAPGVVRGRVPSGARGKAPSAVRGAAPSEVRRTAPGTVRGKAQSISRPGRAGRVGRAVGQGRRLGAAGGAVLTGNAVGQGAQQGAPPKPGQPRPG